MKKKLIAIITVAVLVLALSLTALAANATTTTTPKPTPGYGYGYCVGGYNFMWDADGNRLSRADAEAKLDQYIEDGYILETDKDYYLEMYDYCVENGYGYPGGCGMRGGRGMGGGCGKWR